MKRVLVFASLFLVSGIVPLAHAEECSNADLRGLYSFVASGTFGSSPFVSAGQTEYDGNGSVHRADSNQRERQRYASDRVERGL
jgi:hypothetical protein